MTLGIKRANTFHCLRARGEDVVWKKFFEAELAIFELNFR